MKICFVSSALSIHTQRWAQYFADKRHEVIIISPVKTKERIEIPGVNIIELKIDILSSRKSPLLREISVFLQALEIHRLVHQIKPDITHIHSLDYIHPLMIGLINLLFKKMPNLIVSTWGSDVIPNPPRKCFSKRDIFSKRLLLNQAKEITATSQFLARGTAILSPKNKQIHVIPFGVDCNVFIPKIEKTPSEIKIGFVKHLEPKYGVEYLLKAMKIINNKYKNAKLIIAGKGVLEENLKQLSLSLGLVDNVKFLGKIPHEKVPDLLAEVDIFVMPSISDSETFGVSAVEAQAMEIPVVATKVGGIPEVVLDGKTGMLVEPENTEQLADAIMKLIENPALRHQMGKAGRKFVMEKYNWKDNAKLMEELYKKCL